MAEAPDAGRALTSWCERRELNPQGSPHWILRTHLRGSIRGHGSESPRRSSLASNHWSPSRVASMPTVHQPWELQVASPGNAVHAPGGSGVNLAWSCVQLGLRPERVSGLRARNHFRSRLGQGTLPAGALTRRPSDEGLPGGPSKKTRTERLPPS